MKRKHAFRDQVLPILLVAFFILFLAVEIWTQGLPFGADTWGHLFRAEYLAGVMRTKGIGAYFTAAWMPNWYMGDPFRTYYPPLTTLLLAPLIYLLGDGDACLRIMLSIFFAAFSSLTYFYLHRTWNHWAACLGAVLAAAAPYQMRTILFEGNLPRMLSLLALPAIAILTDRLLAARGRRAPTVILLGACWAWSILAHPQQALIFAFGMGLYLTVRLILDPEVPLTQAAPWLAAVPLGAIFASPWLLPAYSHGELASIPFLPAEKVPMFSATLEGFMPYFDLTHGQILFGFGSILIGLIAISARPDPRRVAWYLTGMLAIWFSLGPAGVFFNLLPFHEQLLPERFLNFAAFGIPVAAGGLLPLRRDLRWIRAALLAILVTADLIPSTKILQGVSYPVEQAVLETVAATDGGRVALLTYPEPNSMEVYFSGRSSDLINGWALENTPHHIALRRVLSAPEWGPEYLQALFSRWDVRTAVISGGPEADPARAAVAAMGFSRETSAGNYEIWRKAVPSSRVQVIPAQSMLVVGDGLSPFLAAFPFAEETSPVEFDRSQSGRLEEYPVLGLYRFAANSSEADSFEQKIAPYLQAGGTVVVDLSGMEDLFGRTLNLFGVHAYRLSFENPAQIYWAESSAGLPTSLSFSDLGEQGWSGAVYEGLDAVLASVEQSGSSFPILGYKQIGNGTVWFVGANLLYYAQLTGQDAVRNYIRDKVLHGVSIPTELEWGSIPVYQYAEADDGVSFYYDSAEPIRVLVSYTYSPRWKTTVDGIAVETSPRENLIRLILPAGQHRVEIRYQPFGTIWPVLGWMAAFAGAIGCAAGWLFELLRRGTESPKRDFLEMFQKPEGPDGGGTYSPCAHCGFRLAQSLPPTPITYPFQVSHCPICGAGMDDDGFVPGKDLTREEQARALHTWLRAHNYDPRTIHTQWKFSLEEFFKQ